MNSKTTELFDKYLLGKMNPSEKDEFIKNLNADENFKKEFEEYKLLIESFNDYHQHADLKGKFNDWYESEYALVSRNNRKIWWTVSYVAASVALMVTLIGIWVYESVIKETKKQGNEITYLKKEIKQIQNQQNTLVRNIKKMQEKNYAPANSQSTGFLLAPKYILTTFHSIQNADSLFVENDHFARIQAKIIYLNKDLDVALLYAQGLNVVPDFYPYSGICDLGNKVYTLGFPTNQLVYNEGYISAVNGYNNDSAFYQITMSLNPGNSGGPLFNHNGQLVGMIVSKNIQMEGVAFALKSNMLYSLKDSLPADSVKNIWVKVFKPIKHKNTTVIKNKPYIFKISVYQKSI
ncbi:MAG: serine protease [Bacteroidia bacterium]|nr:serine protease [Bacteroidia bacterium]